MGRMRGKRTQVVADALLASSFGKSTVILCPENQVNTLEMILETQSGHYDGRMEGGVFTHKCGGWVRIEGV